MHGPALVHADGDLLPRLRAHDLVCRMPEVGPMALAEAVEAVAAHKAALDACDAGDGVKDGVILNPTACRFDPAALQCKAGDAADCLTAAQVAALRAIYQGPRNPRTGKQIYPGLSVGSEAQMPVLTSGRQPSFGATEVTRWPARAPPK